MMVTDQGSHAGFSSDPGDVDTEIIVLFRGMERSEFLREAALDRTWSVIDRFPYLAKSRVKIAFSVENSPHQSGPDRYVVRFQVLSGRYRGLRLEKADGNVYVALAGVVEHLLERLNRHGDRLRVRERRMARRAARGTESGVRRRVS